MVLAEYVNTIRIITTWRAIRILAHMVTDAHNTAQ